MKGLMIALLMYVPFSLNTALFEAEAEARYIQEQGLELVKLSCYLPTGNNTADGSVPKEGIVSCNREHLGMDCILYDEDFLPVARFECRDIGGNKLLREGKAIDVFRNDMQRAQEFIRTNKPYVYIKWIPRDYEGEIELPDTMKFLRIETD